MILVDTGFLLAFANRGDALHGRARSWMDALSDPLVVTEYVIWELVNQMSSSAALRMKAHQLIALLRQEPSFVLVPATAMLFEAGLSLHQRRPDKEWSLTDCISFHVMEERGIRQALAYDHHFEQAGFEALLRRDPPAA